MSIQDNWMVIGTQKETKMMQIYYSRIIDDEQIKAMIDSLPFIKIG